MPTTERILTWDVLESAGIDTERVDRGTNPQDTSRELYHARSNDGQSRLMFTEDEDGWTVMEYERDEAWFTYWSPAGQVPEFFTDTQDLLAHVREWLSKN